MSDINGNFILCAKTDKHDREKWIPSFVRLSEIKTIHVFEDNRKDGCYFYTYKDEWYVCYVNVKDLVDAINNNLGELKGFSNVKFSKDEAKTTRNNSGRSSVRKTKKSSLQPNKVE